ncbi:MAG: hypothetical protein IBX61_05475 [Thermoleophilia bacterium]|nr:hypothetical protein [Thermoleophilia bacterium]
MENLPDLGGLSDQELKSLIRDLVSQEQEISYQRRLLHGKIDILRAELVQRLSGKRSSGESLISAEDVSRLSEILSHGEPFHPRGVPERE